MPPKKAEPVPEPLSEPPPLAVEEEDTGRWIKINENAYLDLCDAEDNETTVRLFDDMLTIESGEDSMRSRILADYLFHILM